MCVCVRERERERGGGGEKEITTNHPTKNSSFSKVAVSAFLSFLHVGPIPPTKQRSAKKERGKDSDTTTYLVACWLVWWRTLIRG